MKNLKKVLALGLALVMLLGMFTIASAAETKKTASDLTDWDQVSHQDAVALMVDLGIIAGKPDGNFDPTGNIDRASWAKMVYYAATGSDDADAYLGAANTLKDITGNWAESYISFLSANKYVSGDTDGNYNPSNNVTVAEACKMMLTVLGYDAEDRGYQNNAAWSGNIMTDAKRNGIMDNVDRTQTALAPLTRENAAEIVYNTLLANVVDAIPQWDAGNKYITTYNKGATLGYEVFDMVKLETTVTSIDTDGYANFGAITYPETVSFNGGSLGNKVKASPAVVGEKVVIFVEVAKATFTDKGELNSASTMRKVISSSVARSASTADKTITGGFVWADLTNSSKTNFVAKYFAEDRPVTGGTTLKTTLYYLNGVEDAANKAKIQTYCYDATTAEERPGTVVEFYLDDDGDISVVKAYHHTVTKLSGDAETRTSNSELQVRVPGVVATWTAADKVTGYQNLKKDDIVLYYKGDNGSYVIEKAEKVTGTVTAANSDRQITVNGQKLKRTGLAEVPASVTEGYGWSSKVTNFSTWENRDDEFDFYLDKNGNVCYIIQSTETVAKTNIALVMAAEWTGTDMSTSAGVLKAKLLFGDGTQEIVTVSKVDKKKVVTTLSGKDNEIQGGPKTGDKVTDGAAGTAIHQLYTTKVGQAGQAFYNYRVSDGKYELTQVVAGSGETDWSTTKTFASAHVEKKADFSNSKTTYTADSKTVFIVAKGDADDKSYYTYTGFKNVPEMKSATGMAVGTNDASGVAKYVYLDTEAYSDDVPDGYIFVYNNKWNEDPDNEDCYLVNIIDVDGTETQMSVDADLKDKIANDSVTTLAAWQTDNKIVGKFMKIANRNDKGVVTELAAADTALKPVTAMGNDVVRTSTQSLDYDNITKFIYVDLAVSSTDDDKTVGAQTLEYSASGNFDPESFFDSEARYSTPMVGTQLISAATKTYDSIDAVMVHATNSTTADYVYVLRVVW